MYGIQWADRFLYAEPRYRNLGCLLGTEATDLLKWNSPSRPGINSLFPNYPFWIINSFRKLLDHSRSCGVQYIISHDWGNFPQISKGRNSYFLRKMSSRVWGPCNARTNDGIPTTLLFFNINATSVEAWLATRLLSGESPSVAVRNVSITLDRIPVSGSWSPRRSKGMS